jgi:hypothetical protein
MNERKGLNTTPFFKMAGIALILIALYRHAIANDPTPSFYTLTAVKTNDKVIVDGNLSESIWNEAAAISDFWEKFPSDQKKAGKRTEVKALFDESYLYISAVCYDTGNFVIQSLKRDRQFNEADAFAILLDPFNEKTMAYYFAVTPYNTQTEDIIYTSLGDPNLSLSWDNKWYSATRINEDHWVVEMAIPFKILKYKADKNQWGINFIRNDRKSNELHSWTNIPLQFFPWDVGYMGTIQWQQKLPKPGNNIFINPYGKASSNTDQATGNKLATEFDGGVDLKSTLFNSMSLDMTVNPDFSQVDVDRQVTNLTRFSLFFPERRGFFVENNDLFSNYIGGFIQPFYSRAIGLAPDGTPLPIYGGVKLSGNINPDLRAGLLNVVTQGTESSPAQNYAALSVNQKVMKRSVIKGYYFDRETLEDAEGYTVSQYGRNAGIEFNYSDQPGKWNAWGGFHKSMKPGITKSANIFQTGMSYNGRIFSAILDFADVGTNYYADMGFVARLENYDMKYDSTFRQGFRMHYTKFTYNIYPKSRLFNNHKFESSNVYFANPDGSSNELSNVFRYSMIFKNSSEFRFRVDKQIVWLQTHISFTPSPTDEPLLPGKYDFTNFTLYYKSDV